MKKLISIALALCLSLMLCAPAFAVDENIATTSGGTANTEMTLTIEAPTFSVTVPTVLAINVSAAGVVTPATNAVIHNGTVGQIEVSHVDIAGQNDWTVVDYDDDMKDIAVNTKNLSLKIMNKLAVSEVDDIPGEIGVINGGADSAPITYAANIPVQSAALATTTVATITFTVRWHEASTSAPSGD